MPPAEHITTPEEAMRKLMALIGLDKYDPNMVDTPLRFSKYLKEFINPDTDLEAELGTSFPNEGIDAMVVQSGIPFRAVCAHHLLPFFGTAAIGYIPTERVVGLSKLARLVRSAGTKKPSMQETITSEIADTIEKVLKPRGCMIVIDAEHTCMAIRGVVAPGVTTSTSAVRGVYRDAVHTRTEFFELCRSQRS